MTNTGSVLNAKQTSYARKVESIVAKLDPSAPAFPGSYIIYAMNQGWTPVECYDNGSRIVQD